MPSKQRKPTAVIRVADGAGGLRTVEDHEFDQGAWPIQKLIPHDKADTWMDHFAAELEERGWSAPAYGQLEPQGNSGSKTIHLAPGPTGPAIDVAWEKPRGAVLDFRARPSGEPVAESTLVDEFFASVDARTQACRLDRRHRRSCLSYSGLPWAGGLWLTESLRLGPPSSPSTGWLHRQVVVVDAFIEGIGTSGLISNFDSLRREMRLVLSPLLGVRLVESPLQHEWIVARDENHPTPYCTLTNVGYQELQYPSKMPERDSIPPTTLEAAARPGVDRPANRAVDTTQHVPHDIVSLWAMFTTLPAQLKTHFLNSCNAYGIALSMWSDQRTACAAFLVIAIEALKPMGRKYKEARVYDVVASLMDSSAAESLEMFQFAPQSVRSNHVHRGVLVADELAARLFMDAFADPSFDNMRTDLERAARVCIIEWLRRGGVYKMKWRPRPQGQTAPACTGTKSARKSRPRRRKP